MTGNSTKASKKNLGQYFTPDLISSFMCRMISKEKAASVLEPSAGRGIFLKNLKAAGFTNIRAFEIDPTLENESDVKIEYSDFLKKGCEEKYQAIIGNPPYVRWKNVPDEVQTSFRTGEYWKDKMNGLSDILYAFMYKCVDCLNNDGELIFITPQFWTVTQHARALRKYLTERGQLEFIITFHEMRLFDSVSSNIVIFKYRKRKNGEPVKIVHLWSKKRLTDDNLKEIEKILTTLKNGEYFQEDIFEAYTRPQFMNGNPWYLYSQKVEPLILSVEEASKMNAPLLECGKKGKKVPLNMLFEERDFEELNLPLEAFEKVNTGYKRYYSLRGNRITDFDGSSSVEPRYIRLGDVADIGNGMVSGLDQAFRVSDEDLFDEHERCKFISVVKAADLQKYRPKKTTPYILVDDVSTEEELERDYPHIYQHLLPFRPLLEKRYNYNRVIPWWNWVFLRNYDLLTNAKEKILVPCKERVDKRGYARFSFCAGLSYATQDVTAIVKMPRFQEDTKYLLALLSSNVIFEWLRYKGLNRGGVFEFSERPLSSIPIRLIDWNDEEEVKIHDQIVRIVTDIIEEKENEKEEKDLDDLVSRLYGIKH